MKNMRASALLGAALLALPVTSAAQEAASGGRITIAAVGDVMMGSDYPTPRLPKNRGRDLLTPAAPLFNFADIAMANLEGPLTREEAPRKSALPGRRYLFRTPPAFADNLKRAGITMVSLANNHALDFGKRGLRSTKVALEEAGVSFSSKDGEVVESTVRGIKVGIVSLSFGPGPRSIVYPDRALDEIAALSRRYDVLILSIHAGAEGRNALHVVPGAERFLDEPRGDLTAFAHAAIDRGADLVVGHGPHVPRALELYRDRLIAYSLGNFATCSGINVSGTSGYAPLITVELARDGTLIRGQIHSFVQSRGSGLRPDPKRRAQLLMQALSREDFPATALSFAADGGFTPSPRGSYLVSRRTK